MIPKVLKKELIKEIKVMPSKDLEIVVEFVDFIRERELEEEILSSRNLINAVRRSQKAWKAGKITQFISWEELKKKHKINV